MKKSMIAVGTLLMSVVSLWADTFYTGSLAGYSQATYTIDGSFGDRITVAVSGDGSTDLDLYAVDGNGNIMISSQSYGDDEEVTWTVTGGGTFRVILVNRGQWRNDFRLGVRVQ